MHAIAASVSGPHRSMEAMGGGGAHMSMSAMVALSSDASRAASDRSMASDSSVGSMIVRPIAGSPPAESRSQPRSLRVRVSAPMLRLPSLETLRADFAGTGRLLAETQIYSATLHPRQQDTVNCPLRVPVSAPSAPSPRVQSIPSIRSIQIDFPQPNECHP